jgi:SWI/SNF-related matrix-associated actin-dependent regulator of chromatin subfamily D
MVPGPQHGQPPVMTPAQIQAARMEEVRRMEAAKRLSKKPTDREIPFELSDVIVGDGVERYTKLRDVERQLDAVMMRKRLDISDNLQRRYTRREGVLRVWVSNTAEGQPWQVMEDNAASGDDGMLEFGENSQATFRVKIEGRLLGDPTDEKQDEDKKNTEGEEDRGKSAEPQRPVQRPRLSNFFKAIRVNFSRNPSLQPHGYADIEWVKPTPGPQTNYDPNSSEVSFDTLEFERKADENINITINLYRDDRHDRFKLSPQLAELLDTEEDDRAGAVQAVWEYCRAMKLQDADDKRWINCDEPLKKASTLTPVLLTNVLTSTRSLAKTASTSHMSRIY